MPLSAWRAHWHELRGELFPGRLHGKSDALPSLPRGWVVPNVHAARGTDGSASCRMATRFFIATPVPVVGAKS